MRGHVFVSEILHQTARVFDLPVPTITGRARRREVILARHAVCLLAREMTGKSYPDIASRLGGRDHSTIIHGVNACRERMRRDPGYRALVSTVRATFGEPQGPPTRLGLPPRRIVWEEAQRAMMAAHEAAAPPPQPLPPEPAPTPWWERSDDELLADAIARHRARGGDFVEVYA